MFKSEFESSEPGVAELEGGRRFGECLSKKTMGSRFPVLLAIGTGSDTVLLPCLPSSTLSDIGFYRLCHPSVPTGSDVRDLWKVNKNHRMRMVECR